MNQMLWILRAELIKKGQFYRSHKVSLISDQIFFILGFLLISGVFNQVTGGHYDGWARLSALIGYLTWRVAGGCMAETVLTLSDDAQYGVLEQVWLSTVHPALIVWARGLVLIVYYSLRVLLMAIILMPLLRIPLPWEPGAAVLYLITLIGAFGLAFAVSGLHLVYQNVSPIMMPLATILLFFSGAMVSLEGVPLFYGISRFLPLSAGIDLMRQMMVEGASLTDVVQSMEFVWLLLNTAVYLMAGLLILHWAQNRARANGSLAHY
jgi:ABC-type multidrug transport system permease subunit